MFYSCISTYDYCLFVLAHRHLLRGKNVETTVIASHLKLPMFVNLRPKFPLTVSVRCLDQVQLIEAYVSCKFGFEFDTLESFHGYFCQVLFWKD